MAVLTRSRAAAERGQNATRPRANQVEAPVAVHETAVKGAAGNRKPARSKNAKASGAQSRYNYTEGEQSAPTVPRLAAASNPGRSTRQNDHNKRREPQPHAAVQSTTQTCGPAFKFTLEYVATSSKAASSPKTDGAASKKPRRGGRSTTKRGPKAKAKAGRADQQKKGVQSTVVASAGTKRRREDDKYEPEESSEDELEPAPVRRTLRRVRRKAEKAASETDANHDAVGEAMNRVRRNKGKAKAVDLPPTQEATVGSKRLRDEDDDAEDVSQQPSDPGPSRRTTRRTRQKVQKPTVEESEKKAARKPRGGLTTAAHSTRRTGKRRASKMQVPLTRMSTPMSCESEEPTFMPSRAPSPEECKVEERPTPRETPREAVVKQEEVSPSPFPRQPPSRQPDCKREPPVSPLMLPALLIPIVTDWPFANPPSHVGGLIIRAEERSSPYLDRDESLSPGGSDKENDPIYGSMSEPEPNSDEDDDSAQDGNGPSAQSIQRPHPRRPLEPLEDFITSVPEGDETEPVSSEDEELDYIDPEEVISAPSTPGAEFRPTTAQREVPSCGCSVDGSNDEVEEGPASGVSSHFRHPVEGLESLGEQRRCSSREVEELLEAPSSPVLSRDLDRSSLREHESPVSPMADLSEPVASEAAAKDDRDARSGEGTFTRSRAPSPSSLPDHATQYLHTPEGTFPLPPCQCGNPARHFVVQSDGEASEFRIMDDDEGL